MAPQRSVLTAFCPDCDSEIYFSRRPRLDQVVVCQECSATLTVVETDPIVLEWAMEEDAYDDDDNYPGGYADDEEAYAFEEDLEGDDDDF